MATRKTSAPRAKAKVKPRPPRRPAPDPNAPEDIRDAVARLKSERIVAAAVDLFYHQGYARTTLDQVAESMHVTKPFIYSHFSSKNDLLAEICGRAIRMSHGVLDRAVALEGTATQRLRALARDFMYTVLGHQAHAVIYSREDRELNPEDRERIHVVRRAFDKRFNALLEEGVASGEFLVKDVHLATLAIGGIVGWAPVWFRPGGRLSQEEAAERVADLVLAMVQAKTLEHSETDPADVLRV
ncbi:MAG: TetR/AcrR family transcriptional regulator [Pseudomonadota bacterium]